MAARPSRTTGGNVAVIVAVVLPMAGVLAAGATEAAFLMVDRTRLQDAADAAALAGARELAMAADAGVGERARAFTLAQAEPLARRGPVEVLTEQTAATATKPAALTVTATARRPSFFGDVLPPGGFVITVRSTAEAMSRTPLCVLAHGVQPGAKVVNTKDSARLTAKDCMVHSNEDVAVEGSSSIEAGAVQSVGLSSGRIAPDPQENAEAIEDPFKSKTVAASGPCRGLLSAVITVGLHVLPAGRHCGPIEVKANAQLTLADGEHYFEDAELKLAENAVLRSADAVLIFDKASKFTFQDSSVVELNGRTKGAYAGFLIVTTRDNTNDFNIWSDNVRSLLGVIYIPAAKLLVQGSDQIAEESDWTVIVADRLELKGAANLVINKDYAGSDVPVPSGVGPRQADVRLRR